MKKIKELIFIQKPPTVIEGSSQTSLIEVEEFSQVEENESISINFGTFLIEGWLDYTGSEFGDQNEFELRVKKGIHDELFLFLKDDEFGRFRQKEEKLLYYLISNQVIRMRTSKTKIFMKENQDLRIIILPFQIILLQDLWNEKAKEIQIKETIQKRLKLLQLESILNSNFFKSYVKQFQMYTEFFQFQNSLLLQSLCFRESLNYKKQSLLNINGGVLIDSRNNLSCFETIYEHVWKKRSFLKKSMIITYNSQLAKQKILEIQNKYPKLVIVLYDPNYKEELDITDSYHLILITYRGVRKQYEIEQSQYGVQTIFSHKWRRIILDRTVETSEFSYPVEVDQLVSTCKWICIQNKKLYDLESLKCICNFFDLNQLYIQNLYFNYTKSSSSKVSCELNNYLLQLNSQKIIFEKQQSIQIENSYFNLDQLEKMHYRDQLYQLQDQENDSLKLQKQYHYLRQLCIYNCIDYNEKCCQICFQPLYVYYQISNCKHIFCIKCIQQYSLCQFCQQSYSQNEIQFFYQDIPQNIVCNQSRMRHLHFLIKSFPKYDRIIIFSQMSACLAEIQSFLNGNGYEVNNGLFSQEAEKTVSQFNYDQSLKILVINPFLVYSLHYEIKQAHHVIFYEPLQDYSIENALWSRLYNIKSITRIIAKSTIEESIIVSSDLWSKHKNLQGFEENNALVKEIINQ